MQTGSRNCIRYINDQPLRIRNNLCPWYDSCAGLNLELQRVVAQHRYFPNRGRTPCLRLRGVDKERKNADSTKILQRFHGLERNSSSVKLVTIRTLVLEPSMNPIQIPFLTYCLFWRSLAKTAAAPESTRTMVPGSGTVGGGGGGGGGGVQLLFFVGVQPLPPPEVGGIGPPPGRGTKPLGGPPPPAKGPPPLGDEGPIGITGSTLRLEPRLGGNASIPLATASGRSSSANSGSSGEVFAWGKTDT